ncbi:bis(5'-nucleosyl)-tetraphosphatase [Paraliobacillus quinghaiensis]|uniref:Bis(5'-nucleosyl)-tetraphosphatase n=1 Tax=Paraliobacillus quinghaiensis TaxID=470815 RepID=A0A917TTC2_9BACI|nr:diacylglycerol kinase family protein [Paraliobacillus quinghaiensis]GGM35270.1 bis(5'-nucleosyl)-tetraphosphatase [Paraliobacillus quinghaiensis]
MNKVAVILNPVSGNGKVQRFKDQIVVTLRDSFQSVTIYETQQSGDGTSIVERVASSVDLIVVAGGDGTVNEVVNAIAPLEERPAFAIIPGGTSNDFSREIGMLQHPLKAAEQIAHKNSMWVDVGKSDHYYFLNFWGIGLITQVSETVDIGSKQNIGRLAYYLRTLQTIGGENPFHLKVETDTDTWEGEAVMLLVGNGTYTGGIRAFFPEGSIKDGLLDVLLIKETSLQTFWEILQSRVSNQIQNKEGIITFQTPKITITADPEQTIDCDGERQNKTPSTVGILPKHIKMIVGNV